jgi:L,D-peptidoglycan transpeptidase YkuD (ErfK/YbiS/YcfS/YnhG family)
MVWFVAGHRRTVATAAGLSLLILAACVQQAPPDLVQAVEALDRRLAAAQSAEFASEEYTRFVQHWVALKERIRSDDVIGWPWEDNPFVADLRALHEEGVAVLALARERQNAEQRRAASRVVRLERRLRRLTSGVDRIGGRVVLGEQRVKTELLVKQTRSFMEQGRFTQAQRTAELADEWIASQARQLSSELGRYADPAQVSRWRAMVRRTVDWSREHHAAALVVVKAARQLTLYRSGRAIVTYPVRLGFNGLLEKRYADDGATPEGLYRVVQVKDRGQTDFYRAFLLDYPNDDDRRRFHRAQRAGLIPRTARIGGNIEVHGESNRQLSQTLGCIMLANRQMDRLFTEVEVGTPVAIVGAIDADNAVAVVLAQVAQGDDEAGDDGVEVSGDQAASGKTAVEQS